MELRSIVAHALRQAFHATLFAAAAWAASSQPARATGPAQPLPAVNTPADVAVRTLEAGPFDGPALDDEALARAPPNAHERQHQVLLQTP
jgi:hypothetical protein